MRILGIDPGTGILGFGVIDVNKSSKMSLVDAGVIRTPVHEDDSVRLLTIFNELKSIIAEFNYSYDCFTGPWSSIAARDAA